MKKIITISFSSLLLMTACNKKADTAAVHEDEPIALFTISNLVSPGVAMERRILSISNESKNSVSYQWEFDKFCNSTSRVPEYSFLTCGGPFTVKLTVTGKSGKTASFTQLIKVNCAETPTGNP